jgi:[FeFe] hydrogenase H-cluster maturation GTPase HydF
MSQAIPSLIPNVVLTGQVNAGKSALFNALLSQEHALVSNLPGTTSDPILKRLELIGSGAINIIDTAGFGDCTTLAVARRQKSLAALATADVVLQVIDASTWHLPRLPKSLQLVDSKRLLVFTKLDLLSPQAISNLQAAYPNAICCSASQATSLQPLYAAIASRLPKPQPRLLDGIHLAHPLVVQVIPIDSEAPAGRIIMPQMQLLRECLDRYLTSVVLQPDQLAAYLDSHSDVGLIICDSQVFAQVSAINQSRFALSSYSILQAVQKGDLAYFMDGVAALSGLPVDAKILMMESCTHNVNHEDIGRIKIPNLLKKKYGDKNFQLEFFMGSAFPDNLSGYAAIIHCGSCMLSSTVMQQRIAAAKDAGIPMLNYGLFLAHCAGILDEATAIYPK